MNKTIYVNGMSCGHCKNAVEKALNSLDGVSAVVDLDNKYVNITLENSNITEQDLVSVIINEGYEVA